VPVSIDDLIQANSKSIDKLQSAKAQIELKKGDLPDEDQFVALTIISDIDTRLRVLKFTQIHLRTALVVVDFNPADEIRLQGLEGQLDRFIIAGAEVNAVLTSIPPILNAVVKIDAMVNGHIATG
jgi:N-acetylglucosamine-6-phosphate deacetylase